MEIHLGKTKLNQKLTWKSTHVKYFMGCIKDAMVNLYCKWIHAIVEQAN